MKRVNGVLKGELMDDLGTEKKMRITKLPKLTLDNLDVIMTERINATKNDETVIPMLWQGLLEMEIPVAGQVRTAKLYIPEHCPQGTTFVLMNVPAGEDTVGFLQESGWIDKADSAKICLFVLEPEADGWKNTTEEMDYLVAGYNAEKEGIYCLPSFGMYVVGYGPVGTCLQKIVMSDPLCVSAAVFVDAGEVEEAYIADFQKKMFDADFFQEKWIKRDYGVGYQEVPVPVWNISKEMTKRVQAVTDYWRIAAGAEEAVADEILEMLYLQKKESDFTPEGKIVKVAVKSADYPCHDTATTEKIFGFLSQYYRYGMGCCSNMISKKVDYQAMGAEVKRFTDANGTAREYLVYVPKAIRGRREKLPLVIAYHGASQSMRNMFENGLWHRIAEEKNCIVVSPESTLLPIPAELAFGKAFAYRPIWQVEGMLEKKPEVVYASELLDRLMEEYPVDESRIYLAGHSMGCMMINYLGSGELSHRFAAIGGTSGILSIKGETTENQIVPTFQTMGEYDLWDYKITESSLLTRTIDMWLIQDGLAKENNVQEIRVEGASETYIEERYHNYIWNNKNGIPLVRYAWIERKKHTHTPDENLKLWDQWFSKWSIGGNGDRYYEGAAVLLVH